MTEKRCTSPGDFAPLVDWNLPYMYKTLRWSLSRANHIGVVPLEKEAPLFDVSWKAAIIEAPANHWCSWMLQNGLPVQWAPTIATQDDAFGTLSMHQMKRVCPTTM